MASQELTSNPFRVAPIYERHTDSLMVYVKDEPSYAEHLGEGVTAFRSASDGSLIGLEVYGVSSILKKSNARRTP